MGNIRKFHYNITNVRNGAISTRPVGAENLSKALDRGLKLYKQTWAKYPDLIKVTYTGTYNFN